MWWVLWSNAAVPYDMNIDITAHVAAQVRAAARPAATSHAHQLRDRMDSPSSMRRAPSPGGTHRPRRTTTDLPVHTESGQEGTRVHEPGVLIQFNPNLIHNRCGERRVWRRRRLRQRLCTVLVTLPHNKVIR